MSPQTMKIRKTIEAAKTIALFGHVNPDGDCIWSLLGLGKILEKQGKKVSYFSPTPISKIYNFLPAIHKIKATFDYRKYDLIIFVDMTIYDRIATFTKWQERYFDEQTIIVFDHHPDTAPRHALACQDNNASSCAEILFELVQQRWAKYLDKEIATYFYLWLVADSGNFLFDKDHGRIFRNALALVNLGADKILINSHIQRNTSLEQIQFLQLLIKRIKIQGKVLVSYYTDKELEKYKIDQEEAGYGLHILQDINWPKVILILRKVDNTIKWSLRSKETSVNCTTLAKLFGGGWHPWAAGFSMPLTWNFLQQKEKIVTQINKHLK